MDRERMMNQQEIVSPLEIARARGIRTLPPELCTPADAPTFGSLEVVIAQRDGLRKLLGTLGDPGCDRP